MDHFAIHKAHVNQKYAEYFDAAYRSSGDATILDANGRRVWRTAINAHLDERRVLYSRNNDAKMVQFIDTLRPWVDVWLFLKPLERQLASMGIDRHSVWKTKLRPMCERWIQTLRSNRSISVEEALANGERALSPIVGKTSPNIERIFNAWFYQVIAELVPGVDANALLRAHQIEKKRAFAARIGKATTTDVYDVDALDAYIETNIQKQFSDPKFKKRWTTNIRPACVAFIRSVKTKTDVSDSMVHIFTMLHDVGDGYGAFLKKLKPHIRAWIHTLLTDHVIAAGLSNVSPEFLMKAAEYKADERTNFAKKVIGHVLGSMT